MIFKTKWTKTEDESEVVAGTLANSCRTLKSIISVEWRQHAWQEGASFISHFNACAFISRRIISPQ